MPERFAGAILATGCGWRRYPRMGLVMTKVRITNVYDRRDAATGRIPASQIRSIELEALADTGAISMAIPEDLAEMLGAPVVRKDIVRVADGRVLPIEYVGPLWIEVLGRSMTG